MSTGLIPLMKRAALEAIQDSQPTDLRYGTVVGINPLKIQITNRLTLPSRSVVVPKHLTDHEIEVTVSNSYGWKTELDSVTSTHDHDISLERKKIMIHGALKVGDVVALLKAAGGQTYYILDKVEVAN